jgi:hypothetical protein
VSNFLEKCVEDKIKSIYGDNFTVKKDRVLKNFKTYPYPKDVGYWFVRDNDLFLVIDEHQGNS